MRSTIEQLIGAALSTLVANETLDAQAVPPAVSVERTRDPSHGDFACNVAMTMAKAARRNPRELAAQIVAALPESGEVAKVDIAGPGFINFHLSESARHAGIVQVLEQGIGYGCSEAGAGRKVLVEFVSANPTGPLHVGHGRHAAYGDSVARLLEATGHDVSREYYVNDAGRQIDILTLSLWLRYLELEGQEVAFPLAGYKGGYVGEIARVLWEEAGDALVHDATSAFSDAPPDSEDTKDKHIDALIAGARALLGEDDYRRVANTALGAVLEDIRDDLGEFGVHFDHWFSERRLVDEKLIPHALEELDTRGDLVEMEGATWFRASKYGDEKDRVVVRENGQTTYIASDIAYHYNKRERGFDLLLDVLGSDHHGYVARVRAGLVALDQPGDSLEVQFMQFVTLYRGGQKEQMSTRSGKFITLRELRADVGNDAARLFYVMRSNDQHLNFDVDLARSRTEENPVFYIQYAHARICSVFVKLADKNIEWDSATGEANLHLLDERHDELIGALTRYPEVVELAANNRAPHHVVHYLRELASDFNKYYNDESLPRFIEDTDVARRNARLALISATRQVLVNGLDLLGVSAPESM